MDECLSHQLVAAAKERGFLAEHVTFIGKQGWQDHGIVRLAVEQDYTLVTNNRRDFLHAYARLELHNGLVVLVSQGRRPDQLRLFGRALDTLDELGVDCVNKVIEMLGDGTAHVREWTSNRHDLEHARSPSWR